MDERTLNHVLRVAKLFMKDEDLFVAGERAAQAVDPDGGHSLVWWHLQQRRQDDGAGAQQRRVKSHPSTSRLVIPHTFHSCLVRKCL